MNVSIINAKIITGLGFFLLNISKIKYPTKLQKKLVEKGQKILSRE